MSFLTEDDIRVLKGISKAEVNSLLATTSPIYPKVNDIFEIIWQSIKKREKCTVEHAIAKAAKINPELYKKVMFEKK